MRLRSFCLLVGMLASLAWGQQPPRIIGPVDDAQLVTLHGNTHPLARPQFDKGAAPDELPARRMMLLLSRAPEQQAALDKFLEEQQTPGSANYRRWLQPADFGRMFGPADADVQTIAAWLQRQGFSIERVTTGRSVIEFSGSAGQVRQAFHTQIHKYLVHGEEHWANAEDPAIPAALAPVVRGFVSLNNFRPKPLSHRVGLFSRDRNGLVTPAFTVSNGTTDYYALGPADFATIYNTRPLLQSGNNGAGQTIAILGLSNVQLQDIADFRTLFGLGAGNTSVVIDGPDPGIVPGDEDESVLDLEWANAVAPGAAVILVSAQETETTSGLALAALHVIENNLASIISLSYGDCEANLGTAGNEYIRSLWQQAAAQGITVMVSTGDDGSAGCDNQNVEFVANSGLAVSGLASTPYNAAVGGTDFDDVGTQSIYWSATNDPTSFASAKSYIPERTWNQTCAASATSFNLNVCPTLPSSGTPPASLNLWSGSGGASSCSVSTPSGSTVSCQSGWPKPAWQTGLGVPADGVRDLPDISLFSAGGSSSNSFYVVCQADALPPGYPSCQRSNTYIYFAGGGGTSAAAPSFAGIMALAQQKTGTPLGNINYLLYSLAARSGASCTSTASPGAGCIFNDVVKGNNSVPCQAGSPNCSLASGTSTGVMVHSGQSPAYAAASGYDLATGLGSVNAANLVAAIASAVTGFTPTSTALTLNGATAALTAPHGNSINVGVSVSPTASTGTVSVLGKTGGIDSSILSAGTANWSSKLFPGGSYSVKAHYAGDGVHGASDSNAVAVTINPESSQSFVNLVTFDLSGALQSFTGNNVPYGSPYVLRADVTNAAGTVSSSQGVNSSCSTGNASCPTGTLTVTANGSPLDGGSFPLNSKGFAEDVAIQLAAGTYTLAAAYPGDASYGASTGSSVVTIVKGATSLTVTNPTAPPYQYGTPFQINAALATTSSGLAPTGGIVFFDNGTSAANSTLTYVANSQAGGTAGYASTSYVTNYAPPSIGTHALYAQYPGDTNYANSTSGSFSFIVGQANTWIGSYGITPSIATPTLPVTLFADITSSSEMAEPTGVVTFYDNGTPISGTLTYGGNSGSIRGSGNAQLTAQLTMLFTQLGKHDISVTYSGDANYTAVTLDLGTLTIYSKIPAALSGVTASMNPALINYPTTLSVSETVGVYGLPAPTGTVTFLDNGQPLSGTVTYSPNGYGFTAALPYSFSTTTGTHSITANYSGDANYANATAQALSLSVMDLLPTTIPYFNVSSAAVNQPTSFQFDVNSNYIYNGPVMTGTVTFQDNGVPVTSTPSITNLEGYLIVSMPYTFTTARTHNITVQYSGDSHYAASSNTFAVNVLGPLALQFPNGNSVTVGSSGGTSSVNLNVFDTTNSPMTVALSCTPDSTAATCSLNPISVDVAAGSVELTTVTVTVPALTSAVHDHTPFIPFTVPVIFAGVLAGLPFTTRRKRTLALVLLTLALAIAMASCGGSGGGGTFSPGGGGSTTLSPKTYKFTITGTSGTNTDTEVLTVTVQ